METVSGRFSFISCPHWQPDQEPLSQDGLAGGGRCRSLFLAHIAHLHLGVQGVSPRRPHGAHPGEEAGRLKPALRLLAGAPSSVRLYFTRESLQTGKGSGMAPKTLILMDKVLH